MNQLGLFKVGTGRVAAPKKRSSPIISATIVEFNPYLDGELTGSVNRSEITGKDKSGNDYTASINETDSISATWMPMGSNRGTAPDVRRGERVEIWRYADSNVYYWKEIGLDDNLRRLETITIFLSNESDPTKEYTPGLEQSYYISASTHDKNITIATNKNDGEEFAYTVQINSKDGNITIQDDVGDIIQLDSAAIRILLKNKNGTEVYLEEDEIHLNAVTDIIESAPKNYSINCKNYSLTAETVAINARTSYNVTAPGSFSVDTPNAVFTGKVTCAGLASSGPASLGGGVEVNGSSTFNDPIQANGITSSAPISGPNGSI